MTAICIFIAGVVLLVYSGEKLITYLVRAASGLRVSLFLLAVLFTGIEFDDVAFGIALRMEDLDDVAIGTVIGTAMSMTGLVLALAAVLAPTKVAVPRTYVAAFALSPLPWALMIWWTPPAVVEGGILLAVFVAFTAYVTVHEARIERPVFRSSEVLEHLADHEARHSGRHTSGTSTALTTTSGRHVQGWVALGLAALALCGLVAGAAAMSFGTEGIVDQFDLNGSIFGATLVTATLAIEDVFLTVEPVRRGAPEIGVGNVIGSVVFGMSGKLGVILLAGGSLTWSTVVFTWHLPALVALNSLAAYVLVTGELRRRHGYLLLGAYAVYWVVSLVWLGGVPIDA